MLATESLGLGGVFIGGIRNKIAEVAERHDIPNQVIPLFGMCLGWPDKTMPMTGRWRPTISPAILH